MSQETHVDLPALQPGALLSRLRQLSGQATGPLGCVLAFSGGVDSTVLLHALLEVRANHPRDIALRAIHVDHHLQAQSAQFRRHCAAVARRERVPLKILHARILAQSGASVEEQARDARYALLAKGLSRGELLLTAQHADDQLETVLLALLRGAGPAGLASMPASAALGCGLLLRPLLGVRRESIRRYAQARELNWIEDPTNSSPRFDRNYLRAAVLPAIEARWPGASHTAGRSARHCAEAMQLVTGLSTPDLALALDGEDLEIAVLRRWRPPRQKAVLRAWLALRGARAPDEKRLAEALRMLDARPDARPMVGWEGWQLRRHQGRLLLTKVVGPSRTPAMEPPQLWHWKKSRTLPLPHGGQLQISDDVHGDLDLDSLPGSLQMGWAADREFLATRGSGRRLRKLMQTLQVPAWERAHMPVLYAPAKAGTPRQPLAIGDLWLAEPLRATTDSRRRARIRWRDQA